VCVSIASPHHTDARSDYNISLFVHFTNDGGDAICTVDGACNVSLLLVAWSANFEVIISSGRMQRSTAMPTALLMAHAR
jgi:hypothetical protein